MKTLALMALATSLLMTTALYAQTAPQDPETRRAPNSPDMDKPTAPIKVIIPASADQKPYDGDARPGDDLDGDEIPEEIADEPGEEAPQPPTFFGEPVSGKFVWVLDLSGSMGITDSGSGPIESPDGTIFTNPNRIQVVKSECIRVLNMLTEDDWFAIISFGGNPDVSYYPEMVPGTAGNKQAAISNIQALVASGATPAYPALQRACTQYNEHDLDKIYFLCDGSPNLGGGAPQILADFPGWFQSQKDRGCELVCVHIGDSGAAAQFMQALANGNGGTYIHK